MKVLVAMSGGVDSSVAAAMLVEQGYEVVGATMKLWGGESDSGCCSVSDVEDARRVAAQIGIDHHVFNFSEEFHEKVVDFYVDAHRRGLTPNPCIECNRHLKFDTFVDRAKTLGFDFVATGHHARVLTAGGRAFIGRGEDRAKDQVREIAKKMSLRTALKPDSQDVCFVSSSAGRNGFLSSRIELHPGELYDKGTGRKVGSVDAVELVTVGQRKGLGTLGDGAARYALEVDVESRRVFLGRQPDLLVSSVPFSSATFPYDPLQDGDSVEVQGSAHGHASKAVFFHNEVRFSEPHRRVAPGQTIAFYRGDVVVGSATAC